MKNRLLIEVSDTEPYGIIGPSSFRLKRIVWGILTVTESDFGFFRRLEPKVEVRCPTCGSFTVPSLAFLEALDPKLNGYLESHDLSWLGAGESEDADKFWDLLSYALWNLSMGVVEKLSWTDEEWSSFKRGELSDDRLIYGTNGELVFDVSGVHPLRVAFDDVYVLLDGGCDGCSCYIF